MSDWDHIRLKLWSAKANRNSKRLHKQRGRPWKAHCIWFRIRHPEMHGLDMSLWTKYDRYEHPGFRRIKGWT